MTLPFSRKYFCSPIETVSVCLFHLTWIEILSESISQVYLSVVTNVFQSPLLPEPCATTSGQTTSTDKRSCPSPSDPHEPPWRISTTPTSGVIAFDLLLSVRKCPSCMPQLKIPSNMTPKKTAETIAIRKTLRTNSPANLLLVILRREQRAEFRHVT